MTIESNPRPGVRALLRGSLLPFALAAAVGWCLHAARSTAAPMGHNAKDSGCLKHAEFTATELEREPADPDLWRSEFQPDTPVRIVTTADVWETDVDDGTFTVSGYFIIKDSRFRLVILGGERSDSTTEEH